MDDQRLHPNAIVNKKWLLLKIADQGWLSKVSGQRYLYLNLYSRYQVLSPPPPPLMYACISCYLQKNLHIIFKALKWHYCTENNNEI